MSAGTLDSVIRHLAELGHRTAESAALGPQFAAREAMEAYFTAPALRGSQAVPAALPSPPGEWILDANTDHRRRLLFLHGGGYVAGGPSAYRRFAMWITRVSGCAVLLVDYRLAPENPFPAAVHDAVTAFRWMRAHGPGGPEPAQRTFMLGDSAGGGLALAALLAIRDCGGASADAIVTFSAWTDLTNSGTSMRTNEDPRQGSVKSVPDYFAQLYLNGADPRNPLASPLFGDLKGLPPLLMQTTDTELFFDDSVRFAERARAANVDVQLDVWPGLVHVWQGFTPMLPEAQAALGRAGEFIRDF